MENANDRKGTKHFIIGLTPSDIIRIQSGGTVQVNPKVIGWVDLPIVITMDTAQSINEKALARQGEVVAIKYIDGNADAKN